MRQIARLLVLSALLSACASSGADPPLDAQDGGNGQLSDDTTAGTDSGRKTVDALVDSVTPIVCATDHQCTPDRPLCDMSARVCVPCGEDPFEPNDAIEDAQELA